MSYTETSDRDLECYDGEVHAVDLAADRIRILNSLDSVSMLIQGLYRLEGRAGARPETRHKRHRK